MIPGSVTEVRVRYAETDQMGRAHHMAYVAWFELARTEMMRQTGISYADMERRGILLPVVRLEVDYLKGVAYEDVIDVHTSVADVRSRRVQFDYRVVARESDLIVAEATSVLVCMGRDGRPRRLPDDVRRALASLVPSLEESGGQPA
ncbi:MAG: acyl-CoA thioesterase [Gemmatimonadales bacterium]|nr:MAG: acyl-CoA thioesterase [Gemmatimonadales bacterium]